MATSRERFLDTLDFKPVAKPWARWGAFLWDETVTRWRQEGWDGTPLDDFLELDHLVRVDPWYGPVPEFQHEVLAEDAETVTYVNHEGIVMREFKQHRDMSMPQFVNVPGCAGTRDRRQPESPPVLRGGQGGCFVSHPPAIYEFLLDQVPGRE